MKFFNCGRTQSLDFGPGRQLSQLLVTDTDVFTLAIRVVFGYKVLVEDTRYRDTVLRVNVFVGNQYYRTVVSPFRPFFPRFLQPRPNETSFTCTSFFRNRRERYLLGSYMSFSIEKGYLTIRVCYRFP